MKEAVPNSIELAPPHGVLVTGSNMSGKSTFLRTVGVNVVLAQTVKTCLARVYEALIYRVRSCIGRADDLLAGKSYYLAEVEAVLSLVDASESTEPHLFIFDELFRGTNAAERKSRPPNPKPIGPRAQCVSSRRDCSRPAVLAEDAKDLDRTTSLS